MNDKQFKTIMKAIDRLEQSLISLEKRVTQSNKQPTSNEPLTFDEANEQDTN